MEHILQAVHDVLDDQGLTFTSDSPSGPLRVPLARCTVEITICEGRRAIFLRAAGQRTLPTDDRVYLWPAIIETTSLHHHACTVGKLIKAPDFEEGIVSLEASLPLDEDGTFDADRFMSLFRSLVHPVDSLLYDLDLILGKPSTSATSEPPSRLATATQLHRSARHRRLERMWSLGAHGA